MLCFGLPFAAGQRALSQAKRVAERTTSIVFICEAAVRSPLYGLPFGAPSASRPLTALFTRHVHHERTATIKKPPRRPSMDDAYSLIHILLCSPTTGCRCSCSLPSSFNFPDQPRKYHCSHHTHRRPRHQTLPASPAVASSTFDFTVQRVPPVSKYNPKCQPTWALLLHAARPAGQRSMPSCAR